MGSLKKHPVLVWYGLKKGFRGRIANYVHPILKQIGSAEVEEQARNNRMRAIKSCEGYSPKNGNNFFNSS